MLYYHCIFLIYFSLAFEYAFTIQCIDENENKVDWFYAYKLPAVGNYKSGTNYLYMTSKNYTNWIISNKNITSEDSIIGNTLKPLYTKKDLLYILYNDESPYGRITSTKGHTKGVVLSDETSGFWLIHSVPKFPIKEKYEYPKTGTRYGQSFLCISMGLKDLDIVGKQLQYNEPQIYSASITLLKIKLPNLAKAAMNITVKNPPWYNINTFNSLNGTKFTSFAKSKNFGKDLYEDWLAPALHSNLVVETWPNGPGKMSSNCTRPFQIHNVNTIQFVSLKTAFTRAHDHSKWAVSDVRSGFSWICVGDINRMGDQMKRGGGTVCLENKYLSRNYQSIVTSVEDC